MTTKRAFLIGAATYADSSYPALPSCVTDVWQLKQVLEHPSIGGFDEVRVALDAPAAQLRYEIAEFFDRAGDDDLALLYITGHGLRLTQSTGEFFFVASDTDHLRIEESAIGASYVNARLELCRAPRKVAILDCCKSGGFALGFATRDTKAAEPLPLATRGVYVLSSSGAGQDSFAGEGARASVFTEEIVNGLLTGQADHDGDGNVSVEDLFRHVSDRLKQRALATQQTPVKSAHGVTGQIHLARSAVGKSLPLQPLSAFHPEPSKGPPPDLEGSWPALIDYYRSCLIAEAGTMRPLTRNDVLSVPGSERLLCGDSRVGPAVIESPPEMKRLLRRADDELWYGYPTVVLFRDGKGKALPTPTLAPLIVRQVEMVDDTLVAIGPALPNPQLIGSLLSEEETAQLMATYRPTWRRGHYSEMVKDLRHHLTELGIECVEELRPESLGTDIDQDTPTNGARNCAVLFSLERNEATIGQLLKDLDDLRAKAAHIPETALAGLLEAPIAASETPWQLVAPLPLNESQQNVVVSAMRERLTVATGPPGTGKSQLVADAVATAICAGQKVLVASNNNQAVNEVWERLERLAPGTLIRSGNRQAREEERDGLSQLLTRSAPTSTRATTAAELEAATGELQHVRARLEAVAALERDLLDAGRRREAAVGELGAVPAELGGTWASWEHRADSAARARLFGNWRRVRLFRQAGLVVTASKEACAAFARYASAQRRWHELTGQLDALPDAETLIAAHATAWLRITEASRARLKSEIETESVRGREQIVQLLQASGQPGSGWRDLLQVLPHVRGWAVTNQSARRLPPNPALFDLVIVDEASQCSIAGVLPLLFRARRALVIGDPMQLPHVSTLDPAQEARHAKVARLHPGWLESRQLTHHRHSAFHAFAVSAGRRMLLDEHYRCHPDIARISNRLFYGGQLTVLVDVHQRPRLERPAVMWIDLPGRARRGPTGSWLNQREAERALAVAQDIGRTDPDISVGIVTPFRAQREFLEKSLVGDDHIRAGTAHTFQGGERDVVVLSLVAAEGMDHRAVSWLNGQLNLWNVAVTRARAHLVVIGDRTFWSRQGGVAAELLRNADHSADDLPDQLTQRLYRHLTAQSSRVELNVPLDGYLADAVCGDGALAVLLDRGATDGDMARHLRVQCVRARLLADPSVGRESVRLAAWRLFAPQATV
ncbi:AAA domain-containing protein [Nonomuraea dietziae]|uniref:caspase, EACC1-associated type n=1 Tax=Nonomuraea dietziae TaxID=65515 RepID=UPI0033C59AA6